MACASGDWRAISSSVISSDMPVMLRKTPPVARVPGQPRPVPLSADKKVAGILLHDLIRKAENARVGIGDPFEKHHRRPLDEHLADYKAVLKATGSGTKHVRDSAAAVERILITRRRFPSLDDVTDDRAFEEAVFESLQDDLPELGQGTVHLPQALRWLRFCPETVACIRADHGCHRFPVSHLWCGPFRESAQIRAGPRGKRSGDHCPD
jgi:hypothetical protein